MNAKERNRMERNVSLVLLVFFVGVMMLVVHGRTLVILEDPNCVQLDYDRGLVPFAYDVNAVVGALLPPYECTAGKVNWRGRWCDLEGDPVTITVESAPTAMTLTFDEPAQICTLAGELPVGVHAVVFRLVDVPLNAKPKDRQVTLLINCLPRPNTAPALYEVPREN